MARAVLGVARFSLVPLFMMTPFLFSLAGGMLLVLSTARPEQIAWRFIRLVGFLTFALCLVMVLWTLRATGVSGWREPAVILSSAAIVAALGLVFFAPMAARRRWSVRVLAATGGLAGLAAASLALDLAPQEAGKSEASSRLATGSVSEPGNAVSPSAGVADLGQVRWCGRRSMAVVGQILGGVFVGCITIAWLLGHAYLTATKMTIEPLRHFSRVLLMAVGLRAGFCLASAAALWLMAFEGRAEVLRELSIEWLVVSLRVGVGLVAVAVFAWMVADCVRLRATQSATGILYFGSVFAYMGELASLHLLIRVGWPM